MMLPLFFKLHKIVWTKSCHYCAFIFSNAEEVVECSSLYEWHITNTLAHSQNASNLFSQLFHFKNGSARFHDTAPWCLEQRVSSSLWIYTTLCLINEIERLSELCSVSGSHLADSSYRHSSCKCVETNDFIPSF